MLLQLVHKLPAGARWEYEIKWDGYRGIAVLNRGRAALWSRNHKDLGKRFGAILDPLARVSAQSAVLDGELVVLGDDGKPSFQNLQHFEPSLDGSIYYYAFDLLHLNGRDLQQWPLRDRREKLRDLLEAAPGRIRYSTPLNGSPDDLIPLIRAQGLEGLVAKDRESLYEPGKRSGRWQKFKLYQEDEFLICGFLPGGDAGVEALVLGEKAEGGLRYVACLELLQPFKAKRELATALRRDLTKTCPFPDLPNRRSGNTWASGMTDVALWVTPKLKATVAYFERTRDGYLRHAQIKTCPGCR